MATLLLAVIYSAFIGLGTPDSLFGAAWPAIYTEMRVPFAYGGIESAIVSLGTIFSSALSTRVITRFGTNRVTAFSTLLTAAALVGYSFAQSFVFLCLLALPLGLGAGAIDVALNNYVALHYSATQMSFLHCFYGIGVTISPFVLSRVISGTGGWRMGYTVGGCIQLGIALFLFATLPLWEKVNGKEHPGGSGGTIRLSLRETLAVPGVKLMCCLFITTCAIECTVGNWSATFLVEYKGLAADTAASMLIFYYAGMAVGRLISGVLAKRLSPWTIIGGGQCMLAAAIVLLFVPGGRFAAAAGLFCIGAGNGPMFPNFNYLAPQSFGRELSQSVIGVQMAAAYVGIMLAPPLCGAVGQALGMGVFPVFLAVFFAVMLAATAAAKRLLCTRRQK